MIFAVSNERIQWSLNFGPDSVILTVKDHLQQNNKKLRGKSSASLEHVVVPKTRSFGQSFSQNPQLLPTNKEHLKRGRRFWPVVERRIQIPAVMSNQTWKTMNFYRKSLRWSWMQSLDQG